MQSLGDFEGDAEVADISMGEIHRNEDLVDLCEGSMDNEERHIGQEVEFHI